MRLKACLLFFIARSHSAFHHGTDNFSENFVWGMGAVTSSRMHVSHNWYDCSNSVDLAGSDKSHKSLKRCQFALWKFQRGMWVLVGGSEPRIFIWTIEWSLPINSLWTVALHLEATSAETIDKSKTLHSYCPLREQWVGTEVFRTTKSWVSRTERKKHGRYHLHWDCPTYRGER